jgi:O-antigen/teichoic acid export membrane protein
MLLSQTGFPGSQTIFFFLIFATNLLLNLAFIPIFGIYGAAIATSIASVLQVFYLKFFAAKIIKIKI